MWRAALVASVLACARPAAPTEVRSGLKLVLPDGWRAVNTTAGTLRVGPVGRAVLELEPSARPMPELDALVAAVQAEGAQVVADRSTTGLRLVRYELASGLPAFVGVRGVGARTVWCSSLRGAAAGEVDAAQRVCGSVSPASQ